MDRECKFKGEMPFLSVVISFYNEEIALPELLRRLRAVFARRTNEESNRRV